MHVCGSLLKHGGFHIFAKDGTKDVHNFTEGGIGFDGFDDGRHGVFCSLSNTMQVLQGAFDGGVVSLDTNAVEALEVGMFAYTIDVKCGNFDMLLYDIVIYTNNSAFVLVDFLLVAISGLCDLTLEEAILDASQNAA